MRLGWQVGVEARLTEKGKHVQKQNLGKNSCLNFNLPPLHILDEGIVKEIADDLLRKKERSEEAKMDEKTAEFESVVKHSQLQRREGEEEHEVVVNETI